MHTILKQLKNKIIVSCQPNEGGPQDDTKIIISMDKTAILGGCGGVRIEGAKNICEVKKKYISSSYWNYKKWFKRL